MTSPPEQCGEDWGEIEQFIAGVSELSQSAVSLIAFATETLQRTVDLLGAVGGTVWTTDEDHSMRPLCQAELERLAVAEELTSSESHSRFLQSIVQSGQPQTAMIQPAASQRKQARFGEEQFGDAEGEYLRIGAPFQVDRDVVGVIEVIQPCSISLEMRTGSERLLAMVSDLTGEFLRRQQLTDLKETTQRWRQYEGLAQRAHASLDLRDTAFQLVNDGRLFIGCDRASLVVPLRGQLRTLAISGVDTLDRRSHLVRSMEDLANAVSSSGQWLQYRGETEQLPPQLEKPLSAFADESHAQSIDVVPLLAPSSSSTGQPDCLVGILVLEQFDASSDLGPEERIVRLANLSSSALRNAIDYETLPFLSLARWARRAIRYGDLQRRKLAVAGLLLLLSILALWVIPATHYVEAEGEAQPKLRRNIYAPVDGEVVEVRGGHDETVTKDQILIVLRSRELELELERLQGKYQTTEKKLLAIASARIQSGADDSDGRFPGQLAAEEQELLQQLESQRTQISLVRRQRDTLEVHSPIDGRILTWGLQDLLADRPVQRGQLLVSVADLDGPWVLELLVPDRRVGHVISAQRVADEPLVVTFTLATGSTATYRGTLDTIAGRTEVLGDKQASTRVVVSVPSEAIKVLRPGTTIQAKFDCGRRTLGFVWLHDVYDTVRAWLLF